MEDQYRGFTVEFWFNYRSSDIKASTILFQQRNMGNQQITMSVGIDKQGKLACSPFAALAVA